MKRCISLLMSIIMLSGICAFSGAEVQAKEKEETEITTVTGDEIIEFAEQYLGKPYRRCAKGPNAFDCSGFVYFVFGHFGYDMPCSSRAYWSSPKSVGKVIATSSLDDAQKGDIISWRGHVAIYIGDNKCIEALNSRYGVTERLSVTAHAAGNGSTFRVIRMKGVGQKPVVLYTAAKAAAGDDSKYGELVPILL